MIVPDLIDHDLQVLFVGVNPGIRSAETRHHFAHPSGRLWKALQSAGFTPEVLDAADEEQLLQYRLGLTNLVHRPTTTANLLRTEELRAGARQLERKACLYKPRWVAILGVVAYRLAFEEPDAVVGPQERKLCSSRLWVLPGPTGRNAHCPLALLFEEFKRFRAATEGRAHPTAAGGRRRQSSLKEGSDMKIVVVGGTGFIGTQVVQDLRARGHEAVPAALDTGVNTITGEGLDAALVSAQVTIDVTNSPAFGDDAVLEFFETSGRHLLEAEEKAGVGHHVALTIVGDDRVPDSGYMRAKVAQEELIRGAGLPYTIVRSTQFFEFIRGIADAATEGDTVRAPAANLQPIAAKDAAEAIAEVGVSEPVNGVIEIAGPEKIKLPELIRRVLTADNDPRKVVGDEHARYFGTELTDTSLTAGSGARLGKTTFTQWLAQ